MTTSYKKGKGLALLKIEEIGILLDQQRERERDREIKESEETEREREREKGSERRKTWKEIFEMSMQTAFL